MRETREENIYSSLLKELLLKQFRDEAVKIILFGSRARGDNAKTSDFDIGLIPYGKINQNKITLIREQLENLNIPYKVELVNFQETSEDFQEEALKGAVIWKD